MPEAKRRQAAAAVEISTLVGELPDLISDLVFVVDSRGSLVWANAAMEARLSSDNSLERVQVLEWVVSLVDRLPARKEQRTASAHRKHVGEQVISVSDSTGRKKPRAANCLTSTSTSSVSKSSNFSASS